MPTIIEQLREQCEAYKTHLERDLERLARLHLPLDKMQGQVSSIAEPDYTPDNLKNHIRQHLREMRNLFAPSERFSNVTLDRLNEATAYKGEKPFHPTLVLTVQKLYIIDNMLASLKEEEVDERTRIQNMTEVLTAPHAVEILSTRRNREINSNFLQSIIDILARTFNFKTTAHQLIKNVEAATGQTIIKTFAQEMASAASPDGAHEGAMDNEENTEPGEDEEEDDEEEDDTHGSRLGR
jgi:ribosomal protein L12E/L44/L45/RPP1/RPP2